MVVYFANGRGDKFRLELFTTKEKYMNVILDQVSGIPGLKYLKEEEFDINDPEICDVMDQTNTIKLGELTFQRATVKKQK